MYFILTRSSLFPLVCVSFGSGSRFFCLGRNIFSCMHGFVQDTSYCVCGPGPLGSGAGFRFGTNCFIYGPGPFDSGSRVLFKTKYLAHEVRDLLALGDCSLFGKNFLLVRLREPVFFPFVWSEILLCMRSGTARLREPFCLGRHVYCVCGLGPLGSGSLYWSHMRSGTVSLWEPVLYLPKIIVIRPNRPFWIWHMLVSGSFGSALGLKLITYKCLKDVNIYFIFCVTLRRTIDLSFLKTN